jgi:Secretion system C-terminal sorting domain
MKKLLLLSFLSISAIANAQLFFNSRLVVPEFGNGLIKTYSATSSIAIAADPNFTIALNTLPNGLATAGSPNCVAMYGSDLYVAITGANQRIYKFPNYGVNPTSAIANVSQITNISNDYVGIAFDGAGNLYAAEGNFLDNNLVEYTAASNYTTRVVLGNGGAVSYFANIAFDGAGNLWATDYKNNRLVGILLQDLATPNTIFHSLYNATTAWNASGTQLGNTTTTLNSIPVQAAFAQPEGIDFNSLGDMFIANNNDAGTNGRATIVQVSFGLKNIVLGASATYANVSLLNAANGMIVWNIPVSPNGPTQLGGMQIDRNTNRIYVNEQVGGGGLTIQTFNLSAMNNNYALYTLGIVSTNPGNGGLYFATANQISNAGNLENSSPKIALYPNPSASGNFTVESNQTIKKIIVTDVFGKLIRVVGKQKEMQRLPKYEYSINDLKSGVYMVKIVFDNEKMAIQKLMVE